MSRGIRGSVFGIGGFDFELQIADEAGVAVEIPEAKNCPNAMPLGKARLLVVVHAVFADSVVSRNGKQGAGEGFIGG
jgi:hypothetical protein